MRKLALAAMAAAALAAAGSALAQASNYDNATQGGNIYNPPYPLPRNLETMRNAPPESNYWSNRSRSAYPYGYETDRYGYRYGYPPPATETWQRPNHRDRPQPYADGNRGRHLGNRGDRDHDGVRNNLDRYPNDPSRW